MRHVLLVAFFGLAGCMSVSTNAPIPNTPYSLSPTETAWTSLVRSRVDLALTYTARPETWQSLRSSNPFSSDHQRVTFLLFDRRTFGDDDTHFILQLDRAPVAGQIRTFVSLASNNSFVASLADGKCVTPARTCSVLSNERWAHLFGSIVQVAQNKGF